MMITAGKYVFRFNGFCMANDTPYYIAGVGKFALDATGGLTGTLKSSITQIAGQGAALQHSTYSLSGKWNSNDDELGSATIKFQSPQQTMTGTFDLVGAGTDRYWMISTGAEVSSGNGISGYLADEVVSGEALRIG